MTSPRPAGPLPAVKHTAPPVRPGSVEHLVGLALRGGDGAGDRHVLDHLASEVLPALDRVGRDLLVATAPLKRLCDAALGTAGSALVLDGLDRADLFATPMDAAHKWYRGRVRGRTEGRFWCAPGGRLMPGRPAPLAGRVFRARNRWSTS